MKFRILKRKFKNIIELISKIKISSLSFDYIKFILIVLYLGLFLLIEILLISYARNTAKDILMTVIGSLYVLSGIYFFPFINKRSRLFRLIQLNLSLKKSLFTTGIKATIKDDFFSLIDNYLNIKNKQLHIIKYILHRFKQIINLFDDIKYSVLKEYISDKLYLLSGKEIGSIHSLLIEYNIPIPAKYSEKAKLVKKIGHKERIITELRTFINQQEVNLKYSDLINTSAFDKHTPFLIIGKRASRGKVLQNGIVKFPHISLMASGYKNMPRGFEKGALVIYIFLPRKLYLNAIDLFEDIKNEFLRHSLDIERSFLMITSLFYSSTYIHIGKNSRFDFDFIKNLKQFLYFKTGNMKYAKNIDFAEEIIQLLDNTTFINIIKRLPLQLYLNNFPLTTRETNAIDRCSSTIYSDAECREIFHCRLATYKKKKIELVKKRLESIVLNIDNNYKKIKKLVQNN